MKKLTSHKILIPLVIMIWILVIGQFAFNREKPANVSVLVLPDLVLSSSLDKDTFSLLPDYPNPFLISMFTQNNEPENQPVSTGNYIPKLVKKVTRKDFSLPTIRYFGMVQGTASSSITGLVSVNGHTSQIRSGDSLMGIKVVSITQEQLIISVGDSLIYLGN